MPALFIYSLKLSVCLAVIYLFYYVVLRNLTFYNWNRWFLLIGTGSSFLLPLINVLPFLESKQTDDLKIISAIPALVKFSGPVLDAGNTLNNSDKYLFLFISIIFGLGVLLQAGKLIVQFMSFFRISRGATRLQEGTIKIYQINEKVAPFSFGNAIYLNKNLLQPAELQEIIKHEHVHIIQKHTLDVLWVEFLCLVNWYNPFVWLLKWAVRQNLEFIVDRAILMEPDFDKKYYQYLLLKIVALPSLKIANQFNLSSLKTRITMMNKMQSNKWEIAKFLLALPMMAILLLACQEDLSLAETSKARAELIPDAPPPPPAPELPPPPPAPELPPPPPSVESSFNFEDFLKRNSNIKNIIPEVHNTSVSSMVVELKSGKKEVYNFKNEIELTKFTQRYGYFPVKNLPPPPPPVVLPTGKDHTLFMERNPQVKLLGWQGDKTMVIFLKSGEREEYNLNNPESKAKAEKKYGSLPALSLPKGVTQFTPPVIVKDK